MGIFQKIKELLTDFLYKWGIGAQTTAEKDKADVPDDPEPEGVNGRLEAAASLMKQDDLAVLTVHHDFSDIPSWVEWDLHSRRISIAQMGGALAELDILIPLSEKPDMEKIRRLALVTGSGPDKMAHYVTFLIREG